MDKKLPSRGFSSFKKNTEKTRKFSRRAPDEKILDTYQREVVHSPSRGIEIFSLSTTKNKPKLTMEVLNG
jgi:hypothetical protein